MKSFEDNESGPAVVAVDFESHRFMEEINRQREAVMRMARQGGRNESARVLTDSIIFNSSTFTLDKMAVESMYINAADPTPSVIEFGEHYAERVYETSGDMKREAMQQKTRNRAKGVLGPRASRYM